MKRTGHCKPRLRCMNRVIWRSQAQKNQGSAYHNWGNLTAELCGELRVWKSRCGVQVRTERYWQSSKAAQDQNDKRFCRSGMKCTEQNSVDILLCPSLLMRASSQRYLFPLPHKLETCIKTAKISLHMLPPFPIVRLALYLCQYLIKGKSRPSSTLWAKAKDK